jgi:hypothetical protein
MSPRYRLAVLFLLAALPSVRAIADTATEPNEPSVIRGSSVADAPSLRRCEPAPPASLTTPNLVGSYWLGAAGVELDGVPYVDLRMSAGATLQTTANGFSALATIVDHKYSRITLTQADSLADALHAWVASPHSLTLFSVSGDMGVAFTGNAWSVSLTPVVVVQAAAWIDTSNGHEHGGTYVVLDPTQAAALADGLDAWVASPSVSLFYSQVVM